MSHFVIGVISNDLNEIDKMLEPYDENIAVEPYTNEDGEETTYNANSKWDWYEIGGRWNKMLLTKDGKKVNSAKIKDIDFKKMLEGKYEIAKRFWELYIEGQKPQNKEEEEMIKFEIYKKEYYIDTYKTKEKYAKINAELSLWAIIDDSGWHEQGKMGWFGLSNSTAESEEEFIDYMSTILNLNQDKYLTIVDCHI